MTATVAAGTKLLAATRKFLVRLFEDLNWHLQFAESSACSINRLPGLVLVTTTFVVYGELSGSECGGGQ